MTFDPLSSVEHRRIEDLDAQSTCRSLADAIAQLSDYVGGETPVCMTLSVSVVRLPNGDKVPMVFVKTETTSAVIFLRLPNAVRCQAQTVDGTHLTIPIIDFDEASFDDRGVVTLADGRSIRNVTFKPFKPVMYKFDEDDDAITRYTLKLVKAEKRCIRKLLRGQYKKILDFSEVQKTLLKNHKVLVPQLQKRFPGQSASSLRNTWKRAGFLFPRS